MTARWFIPATSVSGIAHLCDACDPDFWYPACKIQRIINRATAIKAGALDTRCKRCLTIEKAK